MADYYYNNNVGDGDLGNTTNWWFDQEFTEAAGSTPGTSDVAHVATTAAGNSGGACNPGTLFIAGGTFTATISVAGDVTVANGAVVSSGANLTADGEITFQPGAQAALATLVAASLVFDGVSPSSCTITGNCEFSEGVSNQSAITGDCTFNDVCTNDAAITGSVTFTGAGHNESGGVITGDCTFQDPGGSNSSGQVTGLLTVPGTLSGSVVTPAFDHSALGTFGSLAISGINPPAGGGSGSGGHSYFGAPLPFSI